MELILRLMVTRAGIDIKILERLILGITENTEFFFKDGNVIDVGSASNNIIDSLFVYSNYIDAAPVDGSLRVSGKKLSKLIIPIDQIKLNKLYTAHKMKIVATFNTVSNPQYVKIYSNYTIDFKLVGDFDYLVNIH